MKEEQTTQLQKEKAQKNKQRSTKHTHKTKNRVTRTLYLFCSNTLLNVPKAIKIIRTDSFIISCTIPIYFCQKNQPDIYFLVKNLLK